jgi:hypothetical protein
MKKREEEQIYLSTFSFLMDKVGLDRQLGE